MIKVVTPGGFNFDGPTTSLVDMHSRGVDSSWLQKSAAVLTKEMSELRPEKGTTFVHLIALGDMETYGCNRNGDGFPKSANENHHGTFVKHAKWYHNHKNKPHLGHPSFGFVKLSAYNPEMKRVELVVGIDEAKDPDSIQKLASGKDLPVSMACRVPFDTCTICSNKATNSAEYCQHIKEAVTQFTDDGRQIGMINDEPTFFDISKVHRNADRIAFTMRKVASVGEDIILGVDAAKAYGIDEPFELIKDAKTRRRINLLNKLAELEKEIDGTISCDPAARNIASTLQCSPGDLPEAGDNLQGILNHLANAKVSLPLVDFFKLLMGDRFSTIADDICSAQSALPGVYTGASADPVEFLKGADNYEPIDKALPISVKHILDTVSRAGSLDAGPVGGRVQITVLRKQASSPIRVPVTATGKYLAEEYARYKLAFVEKVQDPFVAKMAILQNFG